MAVINYASKDKNSKEYIPLIAWKSTATYIVNYLNPGDLVSIKGRISSIGYQKVNQSFHRITKISVEEIRPLEEKKFAVIDFL